MGKYNVCTNWWDSNFFGEGLPLFSSGTPTFCRMGVQNSCFQNPSESSEVSTLLTGNLLGDDLEKQIKTQDEMRKVGFDLSAIRNKDHTVVKY